MDRSSERRNVVTGRISRTHCNDYHGVASLDLLVNHAAARVDDIIQVRRQEEMRQGWFRHGMKADHLPIGQSQRFSSLDDEVCAHVASAGEQVHYCAQLRCKARTAQTSRRLRRELPG